MNFARLSGLVALTCLAIPLAALAQARAGDGRARARVPAYVPESPPCARAATVAVTARELRQLLRAAARGVVPGVGADELVSSCEVPRGEIAGALNRGGLQAHRARDYDRAVRLWELALGVDPSRTAPRYNLACGYALTGRRDDAIALLEELRAAGEAGARWIVRAREDADLEPLRADPRFAAIVRPPDPAPSVGAPAAAPSSSPICGELEDPASISACVVRPRGRDLPAGVRVDLVEVTTTSDETTAYLVFRDGDLVNSEPLATSSDVPGESQTYEVGAIEVTATGVSVPVTQTTVTTGNTGDPDGPGEIVTDIVRTRVECAPTDIQYVCESRALSRRCRGSEGAPADYVRALCE